MKRVIVEAMAIYHFTAKIVARSDGRSVVAAAAYRAGVELRDARTGLSHDYRHKDVVHSEILLPAGAPERFLDRSVLWNEVEAGEKRKDAQLARDLELALPRELSHAEAVALVRDFVQEQFVARGMIADINVHSGVAKDGEAQPHAHVLLTLRAVDADGFGLKQTAWNDRKLLLGWRERWAEISNERLAQAGFDVRIDHRSLTAQGIELAPQNKIGPAGMRREERGEDAERAAEHREIARQNGELLLTDPDIALRALTHQYSTFTRHDVARLVHRQSDGVEQFQQIMDRVMGSPELVALGHDGRGRERFTTCTMRDTELRMEEGALALGRSHSHAEPVAVAMKARFVRAHRQKLLRLEPSPSDSVSPQLGTDQETALHHVVKGADICAVVGVAGSGKSTMLAVAREIWEEAGFRVSGAALSGIAAEGLESGSGIVSRTLHSRLLALETGREVLNSRDVLVIDEAGMIGSRQMERLVTLVREAGAKLVLVGDPEQLQAIEAGAAFRAIVERVGAAEITEVRRQSQSWQQRATGYFAEGDAKLGMSLYSMFSCLHVAQDQARAREALVAKWSADRNAHPDSTQLILASTRVNVHALNLLARDALHRAGALGEDREVLTERGARMFAAGDQVMFLRNERALGRLPGGTGGIAVKNGTLGTVLGVSADGERLRVRVAAGRGKDTEVVFSTRDYAHFDHGYAATVHKSQGATVDRCYVLASENFDRHLAYVAMSRHRQDANVFYAREDFRTAETLFTAMARDRAKDTTLDYASQAGQEREEAGNLTSSEVEAPSRPAGLIGAISALGETVLAYAAERYAALRELITQSEIVVAQAIAHEDSYRQPSPTDPDIEASLADLERDIAAHRQDLDAQERERDRLHQEEMRRDRAEQAARAERQARQELLRREETARIADAARIARQGHELVAAWGKAEERYNRQLSQQTYGTVLSDARDRLMDVARELAAAPEVKELLRRNGDDFGVEAQTWLHIALINPHPVVALERLIDHREHHAREAAREQDRGRGMSR